MRSKQSILKEISPQCSLEGLMLKLKLQYCGHLMWRVDSLEKTLMLRGMGGRRRRWRQWMRSVDASPTRWTWVWVNSRSWWWTKEAWRAAIHGVANSRTRLSNWTELKSTESCYLLMKTYTDMHQPHLDFHLCLHSSLVSYCTEEINVANQAVFILVPVLAWPCTNLHLVFWAQSQACFQLLRLTWLPPAPKPLHIQSSLITDLFPDPPPWWAILC